ncbi:GTPase HflX [Candidatus Woesebacteria bacterium]|nr:GTPase HflX [Candidatus Woesebacteria bacterium]
MQKYILVHIVPPTTKPEQAKIELKEAMSLIKTLRSGKVIQIIQRRGNPHPATYIGTGKAAEIAALIQKNNIDVVIINAQVKPTQLYKLTKMYWEINPKIQVWDRIDLILHIFDKHAVSAEAKLQIELARMRHMGPRVYGLAQQLGRQAGGIGTRGIGETNVELMKRHWRDAIKKTTEKLKKQEQQRTKQLQNRKKHGLQTISIVGYTNAGKTTLFNLLTNKEKIEKDELFVTLDTTTGKMYAPKLQRTLLVADTIGFIQSLPPNLIMAFKSTLLESIHADLLLHVVDASDPQLHEKIMVVNDILHDIGVEKTKPTILLLNKIDELEPYQRKNLEKIVDYNDHRTSVFISAQTGEGIGGLKTTITIMLQK